MAISNRTVDRIEGEEWRPIAGSDGWYSVSNLGRVRRDPVAAFGSDGRRLAFGACLMGQQSDPDGYRQTRFSRLCPYPRRMPLVHRLVFEAFVRPIGPDEEINHINAVKWDNRVENLEAVPHLANMQHAVRNDLFPAGDRAGGAKLTNEQAVEIARRRAIGERVRALANEYGVKPATISNICAGRVWGSVTGLRSPGRLGRAFGERSGGAKLTTASVERIFALRAEGLLQREIGAIVGASQTQVGNILRGKAWRRARQLAGHSASA